MKQETKAKFRVGTDFISGVFLRSFIFCFCRNMQGKTLSWITVTIWCRFRKIERFWFTAKGGIPLPHF